MERISRWIVDNFDIVVPGSAKDAADVPYDDYIQVLCRDKVMDPRMTLASVKHFTWKSSADILLTYRINDKFKKK